MTIREAGKGVVVGDTGAQTYRIGFNGNDETELDAKNMSRAGRIVAVVVSRVRMQGKQRGLCGKGVGNEHSSKRIKQRPDSQGE